MFIYAFIIYNTPSYEHLSVSTLQQEFKVHSLKAIQHVSSGIHVYIYIYIYIQYQINILKPLQCPQLQRAQGYVQLAPARKLA